VSSEARDLEARLTDGYARVHELERTALRLARECDDLLARGAAPADVSGAMSKRRAVEMELAALRRRLERCREDA
jgi:hypothetical protein